MPPVGRTQKRLKYRALLQQEYGPVKAVILAAGKGTRMRELTNEQPKPMLKVQGKPILEHILQGLIAADIREVFIVTGFRADTIEAYFAGGTINTFQVIDGPGCPWKKRCVVIESRSALTAFSFIHASQTASR